MNQQEKQTVQDQINMFEILIAEQARLIERQEKEIQFLIRRNHSLEQEREIVTTTMLLNPVALLHKEGKA